MLISHGASIANVYDSDVNTTGCCLYRSPTVNRIHGPSIAIEFVLYVGAVYPANALSFLYIGLTSSRSVAYISKFKLTSRLYPV